VFDRVEAGGEPGPVRGQLSALGFAVGPGVGAIQPAPTGDDHDVVALGVVAEHGVGDDRQPVAADDRVDRLTGHELDDRIGAAGDGVLQDLERPDRVELVEAVEDDDRDAHRVGRRRFASSSARLR
jgi:hypothetical protein